MSAKPPTIDQVEMTEADVEFAERIAKRLGFTQTAYTSSSELWGLYCLPDHEKHRHGCIIKTKKFGFLFVADLGDMQLHDMTSEDYQTGHEEGFRGGITKPTTASEEYCRGWKDGVRDASK